MKENVILDSVYLMRLISSDLFEKIIDRLNIFITPAILMELNPKHIEIINQIIKTGKITLVTLDGEKFQSKIAKLYKKHKSKAQEINFLKKKFRKLHDLGEMEICAFLLEQTEYKNPFIVLTFDKNAKKMIKIYIKLKGSLIDPEKEKDLLGFNEEEMKNLRRGSSHK